jgi:hypothetical protein
MNDVLIPLGLFLFIGLFAYAIVQSARKQRKAKARVFRDFAESNGFRYQEQDDGRAQEFARNLDGIGRFRSPSLGKVIPVDVVEGTISGTETILFRHSVRSTEDSAREWFVVGVTCHKIIAERCAVQFCMRRTDKITMYLEEPVVKERKAGHFNLVVRAASPACAGKIVDDEVLRRLASLAGKLSFRPEIQVRGNRLAVYLADRNATVDDVETLQNLLDFARSVATV